MLNMKKKDKKGFLALVLMAALIAQMLVIPNSSSAQIVGYTESIDIASYAGVVSPAGAIQSVKLSTSSDTNVDGDLIPFEFEIEVNQDFINSEMERENLAPIDSAQMDQTVRERASLQPISCTFTFQGDGLANNPILGVATSGSLVVDGDIIGSYTISSNSNKTATFTCIFDKVIYNRFDITVGGQISLKAKDTTYDQVKPYLMYDTNTGFVSIDLTSGAQPADDDTTSYSVAKSAPSTITTNELDYTIRVSAKRTKDQKKLMVNGKTIVDMIPQGLELIGVTANGTQLLPSEYSLID